MLQVAIHHHDPLRVHRTQAGLHGSAEPADPLTGRAVQQPDRHRGSGGGGEYRGRGVIGAVIDEQHLAVEGRQHRAEPVKQRGDVADLVTGRHYDAYPPPDGNQGQRCATGGTRGDVNRARRSEQFTGIRNS